MKVSSFPAVVDSNTRVLVLGSMPGRRSIELGQYYASPRNRLWQLMQDLFRIPTTADYLVRLEALRSHGVGLWDVLKHCERDGSLDSAIRDEEPNDFVGLAKSTPKLRAVVFNGQKAATSFARSIGAVALPKVELIALPSTSPANAGIRYEDLLERWHVIKNYADAGNGSSLATE